MNTSKLRQPGSKKSTPSSSPSNKSKSLSRIEKDIKSSGLESSGELDDSMTITNVLPEKPIPALDTSHRQLDKCPCNQSLSSWKIDCSKCHQFWHVECLKIDGLTEKAYNKMVHYLCPFCYVPPVPTMKSDLELCYICRNTLTLQQANSRHEVVLAANKLESLQTFSKTVSSIDFDSLSEQLQVIQSFDLHLKHLLLNEGSLKEHQCHVKNVENSISDLSDQVKELQSNVTEFCNSDHSHSSTVSDVHMSTGNTDDLLASISAKLDQLVQNEPVISASIADMQQSLQNVQSATPLGHTIPVITEESTTPTDSIQHHLSTKRYEHNQLATSLNLQDFIDEETENTLISLLSSNNNFKEENGHSVLLFGEPYKYNGSKATPEPIPPAISSIIERINNEHCSGKPAINSCLVNRYEGSSSCLPQHSDNEVTIHPESTIFTLSLGQQCSVKFSENNTGTDSDFECMPRSLYGMSRKSQEFYQHRIEPGSIREGVRYSLTMRSVDYGNRNSTCIIGDSNTCGLKFGTDGKKSFGKSLPGKQFYAATIDDIDPYSTCGYSNVVIMCGINDIRKPNIRTPAQLREIYNFLVFKINAIEHVNPRANIFICPILPTKSGVYNKKALYFINLIRTELLQSNFGVTFVNGFDSFLGENGLLCQNLSRELDKYQRLDYLHLNWKGVAQLGRLIRDTVLLRAHGGVDRRKRSSRVVDGRSYRDVTAGRSESHPT